MKKLFSKIPGRKDKAGYSPEAVDDELSAENRAMLAEQRRRHNFGVAPDNESDPEISNAYEKFGAFGSVISIIFYAIFFIITQIFNIILVIFSSLFELFFSTLGILLAIIAIAAGVYFFSDDDSQIRRVIDGIIGQHKEIQQENDENTRDRPGTQQNRLGGDRI